MDNVTKTGERPSTVVIPGAVHRALIRNKLKFSDYINFEKVKNALSSEDIKHWYSVIESLKIGGQQLSAHLMDTIWCKGVVPVMPSGTTRHMDPYFMPSAQDLKEAQQFLNESNAMTEDFYSLHREGTVIYVVVEEGFSLKLEENPNKLEFLKTYFKKLCEITPVHMLAKDPLHLQYVSIVTS